jgi:membrane-bound lytic murein transglycosylase D
MEEPFPMKTIACFLLLGASLLAGCAAPMGSVRANVNTAASSDAMPSPAVMPADPKPTPTTAPVSAPTPGPSRFSLSAPYLAPPGSAADMRPIEAVALRASAVAALEPPADIWDRIRRGFAMPDLETDLAQDRTEWYVSRPDYMQRMAERSRKYLFHIVEELERRNMPSELALLPFIESAFNPQAVSHAKAAGMWQFMPATGRDFDLKQNMFRDDRRDVLESTRAALDYLQKLYRLFGDWHLALAAYNWGEGSVMRAMARNRSAGMGLRYTELRMPDETRYYVPKLQAVKNIVARPDYYRTRLPDIPNHPFFDTVDITRDIDVALAARLAEVAVDDFRALNPSVNRPVILAAGTPQVLLPWDNAAVFKQNLAQHGNARLASWTAWQAPVNMTVAEAARRVGTSEAQLREVNGIPPRMLIKAGSALVVPRKESQEQDVASHVADNGQLALAPEVVLRRSTVKARKGETVASLAARLRLSATSVAEWNRSSPSAALKAGQAVVVYLPVPARAAARGPAGARKAAPAPTRRPPARPTPARPRR